MRAAVVHPARKGGGAKSSDAALRSAEAKLAEAVGLGRAIDLDCRMAEIVPVSKPTPATLIGSGTVKRLAEAFKEAEIDLVVVDAALSPIQQRNLEKAWSAKVIDRTGLILEIFGARARTAEGTLQVELASLNYQRSRLVRSWTHLERQRGGFGFLGGPGETQIEADRRLIGDRIVKLKRELTEVKRTRDLHRKARRRVPYPIIALVGYTNAGKSTLFNRLTQSAVVAEDMLFATLDPTLRGIILPSGKKAILSDTVGFISDLPHELVAAFRATLEEVLEADVIIHVRDISHDDSDAQNADVITVLKDLGLDDMALSRMVEAQNKIDSLGVDDQAILAAQARRKPHSIPVSALTGQGLDALMAVVEEQLGQNRQTLDLEVSLADGAQMAWLYRHGEVIERHDDETLAHIRVRLAPVDMDRFHHQFGVGLTDDGGDREGR